MQSEIIIVPALFITIGFVVWVAITGWQRRQRLRLITDFNSRLLDRLGSVKDFSEFLQTEAGAQFMHSMADERPTSGTHDRILRAVQLGMILLSLGGGLLFLGEGTSIDDHHTFTVFGTIALSLSGGFLLSALASYRLASALGVLHPPSRGPYSASR
jgi:hypothetical protein